MSAQVDLLSDCLSPHLKCVFDAASEQGASSWLTTLPIAEHGFALRCPCGGFPSIHHKDIQDFTAKLLSEVCNDIGVEPALQQPAGEPLRYATVNGEDGI